MPRGSLDIAMTEAYLPQQHKQKQPALREYLVKAEMWYKNPNASRKVSSPSLYSLPCRLSFVTILNGVPIWSWSARRIALLIAYLAAVRLNSY